MRGTKDGKPIRTEPASPPTVAPNAARGHKRKRPSMASVRHAFRTFIWPRRRLLLAGLILIFVDRVSGLVLPGSTKFLIDDVIVGRNMALLGLILAVVAIAVTIQAIISFVITRLLALEAQRLISELRVHVQKHVIHLPLSYFDRHQSGALVSRIMHDVEGVRNLVGTGLVQLVGGIFTSLVAFGILLHLNSKLTLFALIPLAAFGWVSLKAFSYIRPIYRERGRIHAEVTGRLTESLGGIRVVKGFNAEEREEKSFEQGVDRIFQNSKRAMTTTSLMTSGASLLFGLSSVFIMFMGSREIVAGNLTVGEFFAFILYLGFLVSPVMQMANVGTQMTEAFAGLDRMDEVLSVAREGEDAQRTVVLGKLTGDIRFDNVHFAYEEGTEVLSQITFHAPPDTITALVGASGAGKTTIAGLAASFATPTRGSVSVDGVDLSRVKIDSYRRQLGLVLQEDFLFAGTIRENILFAKPEATEAELLEAVTAAYVNEFTDRFEKGLATLIGERGIKLSGGQRQRVTIARALLADPRILILDEATSNLDMESESSIQKSLARLMQGRTTLVIAHRLSTIRRADQILVIEGGRIVERGTHDELIRDSGRYYQLYTYQARI